MAPTSAQQLMLFRERTDAVFPSNKKKDKEKGLRKWIALSYNEDPNSVSEKEFNQITKNWHGYEAAALEFLFMSWILKQKEKKAKM